MCFVGHSYLKAEYVSSIFILMWSRLWQEGGRVREMIPGRMTDLPHYCWGLNAVMWIRHISLGWAGKGLHPHVFTSSLPFSPSGFLPHFSALEEKQKSKNFFTFSKQRHCPSLPPQPALWSSTALVSPHRLEPPWPIQKAPDLRLKNTFL